MPPYCPHSSMDRAWPCGGQDPRSNRSEGTLKGGENLLDTKILTND